jgi:hypothetical protein
MNTGCPIVDSIDGGGCPRQQPVVVRVGLEHVDPHVMLVPKLPNQSPFQPQVLRESTMVEPGTDEVGMISPHHATPLAARHQMHFSLRKRLKEGVQCWRDHYHVTGAADAHHEYFLDLRHENISPSPTVFALYYIIMESEPRVYPCREATSKP